MTKINKDQINLQEWIVRFDGKIKKNQKTLDSTTHHEKINKLES